MSIASELSAILYLRILMNYKSILVFIKIIILQNNEEVCNYNILHSIFNILYIIY